MSLDILQGYRKLGSGKGRREREREGEGEGESEGGGERERGREREREREREGWREGEKGIIFISIFYLYCRITCITGEKQGSVVSDKVFITFAHRQGERIQSEDNFDFVVRFHCHTFKREREREGGRQREREN